jgi:hypothetical protein
VVVLFCNFDLKFTCIFYFQAELEEKKYYTGRGTPGSAGLIIGNIQMRLKVTPICTLNHLQSFVFSPFNSPDFSAIVALLSSFLSFLVYALLTTLVLFALVLSFSSQLSTLNSQFSTLNSRLSHFTYYLSLTYHFSPLTSYLSPLLLHLLSPLFSPISTLA